MNFDLTDEQKEIIQTDENIKVEATAGSAKTTTSLLKCQELEKTLRKQKKKTLYLVFNRSSKDHAKELVSKMGLKQVQVDTAHSLAYRTIVIPRGLKVGYDPSNHSLSQILKISDYSGFMKYVLANHVKKLFSYYCNSAKQDFDDYNYINDIPVSEKESYEFALSNLDKIQHYAKKLYLKMKKREIDCTHDFYLKEFQLSGKQLPYPRIIFDEAQDASPVMLSAILGQEKATKTFVGDSNQSIYGFRKAMNALQNIDNFKELSLSVSFRYPRRIAEIGKEILSWKQEFDPMFKVPDIDGVGKSEKTDTNCVIGRTNSEIFFNIVTQVIEEGVYKDPYFEGGLNGFLKSDGNVSIFDLVNLREYNLSQVRNKFVKGFDSYDEFKSYAKKSGENDLKVMMKVVDNYGKKLFKIVKDLESKSVDNKKESDVIYSTVHKAKGLEYDRVTLLNDFQDMEMLKEKFDKLSSLEKSDYDNVLPFLEEINMLYVAATRTKNVLNQSYVC